jgi:hypothetical protein
VSRDPKGVVIELFQKGDGGSRAILTGTVLSRMVRNKHVFLLQLVFDDVDIIVDYCHVVNKKEGWISPPLLYLLTVWYSTQALRTTNQTYLI